MGAIIFGTARRGLPSRDALFRIQNIAVHPPKTSVQIIILPYDIRLFLAFVCRIRAVQMGNTLLSFAVLQRHMQSCKRVSLITLSVCGVN